ESVEILFNTAALQYELGRLTEARTNAKIVAESNQAKEVKLNYPKNETEQQEIPMSAAAYNLLGILEKDQGNKEQAKAYFDKALEIAPDFQMAIEGKSGLN
ncbi:MAG TPA: tetratricopeptide repeat protein, partial [Ignavibacteriaceae bacterium]